MELALGIACGRCDWYSAMGTAKCPSCGQSLSLGAAVAPAAPAAVLRSGGRSRARPAALAETAALHRRAAPRKPPSGVAILAAPAASRDCCCPRGEFGGIVVRRVR